MPLLLAAAGDTVARVTSLTKAYDDLALLDPVLGRLIEQYGRPDPFHFSPILDRVGDDRFRAMLLQITSQQISTAAALAIFDRLVAAVDGEPTPAAMLKLSPERLRELGLSHAKALAVLDLAGAVETGRVDLDDLPDDDEAAIALLSTIRGIGRWSAQIFLIVKGNRGDILPAGDLGIRHAVQALWGLPETPTIKAVEARGLAWSPYRTYAAMLLWTALGDLPKRPRSNGQDAGR
jgi:DNA-3-methyladenine glycosylase II